MYMFMVDDMSCLCHTRSPSQRRALHNRSQTIDLRSPDGEGGGQQGRQLPGNSPANMTGQADQAGELASQGLTDEELAAKLQVRTHAL